MSPKRRWTYVITAIAGATIVILAVILMQQPIPTSNTPPVKTPPAVSTAAATGVADTTATLNGNLAGMGTAATVSVGFRYGTSADLSGATNVTVGTEIAATGFDEGLSGLTAGTTYYFAAWGHGDGFVSASVLSFTTTTQPSPQVRPPTVSTEPASAIGTTGANLNGALDGLGTATAVTTGFRYSLSQDLSGATNLTTGTQTVPGAFSQPVTGLTSNTTYYVQAWASGNGFVNGTILSFKTTAPTSPGNGNIVPPGWAHAACPDVPEHARAYGMRARCEFNMTYGEMKKQGLTFTSQPTTASGKPIQASEKSSMLRAADPGNSGAHRSDKARQW